MTNSKQLLRLTIWMMAGALLSCEDLLTEESDLNSTRSLEPPADTSYFHLKFDYTLTSTKGDEPAHADDFQFNEGISGAGISFDRLDILNYPAMGNINSQVGTASFWIKPNFQPRDGKLYKLLYFGTNPKHFEMHIDENGLVAFGFNTAQQDGNPIRVAFADANQWQPGTWYHVAYSWDFESIEVYVNGLLHERISVNFTSPMVPDEVFHIGSTYFGPDEYQNTSVNESFYGAMDEVRVYQQKLNEEEIFDLYSEFVEVSSDPQIDGFTYGGSLDGSDYYISEEVIGWNAADSLSRSSGGHLISISCFDENQLALKLLDSLRGEFHTHAWIGLTDRAYDGEFIWVEDGSPIGYEAWDDGEPNNEGYLGCQDNPSSTICEEDYVHIHGGFHTNPGSWNDAPEGERYFAIMEIVR